MDASQVGRKFKWTPVQQTYANPNKWRLKSKHVNIDEITLDAGSNKRTALWMEDNMNLNPNGLRSEWTGLWSDNNVPHTPPPKKKQQNNKITKTNISKTHLQH